MNSDCGSNITDHSSHNELSTSNSTTPAPAAEPIPPLEYAGPVYAAPVSSRDLLLFAEFACRDLKYGAMPALSSWENVERQLVSKSKIIDSTVKTTRVANQPSLAKMGTIERILNLLRGEFNKATGQNKDVLVKKCASLLNAIMTFPGSAAGTDARRAHGVEVNQYFSPAERVRVIDGLNDIMIGSLRDPKFASCIYDLLYSLIYTLDAEDHLPAPALDIDRCPDALKRMERIEIDWIKKNRANFKKEDWLLKHADDLLDLIEDDLGDALLFATSGTRHVRWCITLQYEQHFPVLVRGLGHFDNLYQRWSTPIGGIDGVTDKTGECDRVYANLVAIETVRAMSNELAINAFYYVTCVIWPALFQIHYTDCAPADCPAFLVSVDDVLASNRRERLMQAFTVSTLPSLPTPSGDHPAGYRYSADAVVAALNGLVVVCARVTDRMGGWLKGAYAEEVKMTLRLIEHIVAQFSTVTINTPLALAMVVLSFRDVAAGKADGRRELEKIAGKFPADTKDKIISSKLNCLVAAHRSLLLKGLVAAPTTAAAKAKAEVSSDAQPRVPARSSYTFEDFRNVLMKIMQGDKTAKDADVQLRGLSGINNRNDEATCKEMCALFDILVEDMTDESFSGVIGSNKKVIETLAKTLITGKVNRFTVLKALHAHATACTSYADSMSLFYTMAGYIVTIEQIMETYQNKDNCEKLFDLLAPLLIAVYRQDHEALNTTADTSKLLTAFKNYEYSYEHKWKQLLAAVEAEPGLATSFAKLLMAGVLAGWTGERRLDVPSPIKTLPLPVDNIISTAFALDAEPATLFKKTRKDGKWVMVPLVDINALFSAVMKHTKDAAKCTKYVKACAEADRETVVAELTKISAAPSKFAAAKARKEFADKMLVALGVVSEAAPAPAEAPAEAPAPAEA